MVKPAKVAPSLDLVRPVITICSRDEIKGGGVTGVRREIKEGSRNSEKLN